MKNTIFAGFWNFSRFSSCESCGRKSQEILRHYKTYGLESCPNIVFLLVDCCFFTTVYYFCRKSVLGGWVYQIGTFWCSILNSDHVQFLKYRSLYFWANTLLKGKKDEKRTEVFITIPWDRSESLPFFLCLPMLVCFLHTGCLIKSETNH